MNNAMNVSFHTMLRAVCLLLAVVALSACDSKVFYADTRSVPEEGWSMGDPLLFEVDIDDTTQFFNIFVDVRNTVGYAYSNTFLFITTTFPDSTFAADTLECPLADPTGRWYGKCGGRYVDNRYYFKRNTRFPMTGTYHFKIIHGMRNNDIAGLKDVGLRFEKVDKK